MGKIDHRTLPRERYQAIEKEIASSLANYGLQPEGADLLVRLLTRSEVVMLGRRIQIAKRLLLGHSFPAIARDLHVGTSTIRGVHTWLNDRIDDYRITLPPLLTEKRGHITAAPNAFAMLRKKYPAHFLLINLLLDNAFKRP